MRASDADRDAVAARLTSALQEGRLDLSEYDDRLSATMRAKTMGDLTGLTADLPDPPSLPAKPIDLSAERTGPDPAEVWRRRLEPWRGPAGVSALFIGIWAATSILAQDALVFWPLIPIGIMFIFTLAGVITGDDSDDRHHRPGHD